MFTYRMWQPSDTTWLMQAAAIAAWESLSDAERSSTSPALVMQLAGQQLQHALSGPHGTAIIAQAGQQPIGFALLAVGPDATTGEIHGFLISLWVAPQFRRRGAARQLQRLAESLIAQAGIRKLKVVADLHNQPWVRLVQGEGFVPEGLISLKIL